MSSPRSRCSMRSACFPRLTTAPWSASSAAASTSTSLLWCTSSSPTAPSSTTSTASARSCPWRRRLTIAHQTAEGLAYLHSSAVPPIYHRDVKSSNILLDDKLYAKVSDFGLSRLAEPGISHVSTCAQGTLGYLDPEYYRNYQLTDKSDVYSYGVVLLELLTSQKAIDFNRGPDDVNLAVHVQRNVEEEKLMDTVDGALKEGATQVELDTMKALGFLAMGCLEEKRQNRPSMKEVTEEIEYIINILDAGGVEKLDSA
ncbi:unnamed protein product [Musa textilis]